MGKVLAKQQVLSRLQHVLPAHHGALTTSCESSHSTSKPHRAKPFFLVTWQYSMQDMLPASDGVASSFVPLLCLPQP